MRKLFEKIWHSLWVQLIYNPFHAMDLTDDSGKTDHGKVLPAILLISAIVAQFLGKQFDAFILIILGSLSYGYGAWRSFLKSRNNATQHTQITVTRKERERDLDTATDPTDD